MLQAYRVRLPLRTLSKPAEPYTCLYPTKLVIARLPFNPSESKSTCTRAHRRKDPSTIEAVLKGCQALLFVQLPSFTDDAELQEARVVLKLAKDAGVQQVVFSSSLVLNNPNAREDLKELSAAPAVTKKAAVEDLVKASGMLGHYFVQGTFSPISCRRL